MRLDLLLTELGVPRREQAERLAASGMDFVGCECGRVEHLSVGAMEKYLAGHAPWPTCCGRAMALVHEAHAGGGKGGAR